MIADRMATRWVAQLIHQCVKGRVSTHTVGAYRHGWWQTGRGGGWWHTVAAAAQPPLHVGDGDTVWTRGSRVQRVPAARTSARERAARTMSRTRVDRSAPLL